MISSADVKTYGLVAERGSFLYYVGADLSGKGYLRGPLVGKDILGGNSIDFGNVGKNSVNSDRRRSIVRENFSDGALSLCDRRRSSDKVH